MSIEQQQAIAYIDWLIPKLRDVHDAAKGNMKPFPKEDKSQCFWFESSVLHNAKQEKLAALANELYAVVATLKMKDEAQSLKDVEKVILNKLCERLCDLDLSNQSTNPISQLILSPT